MVQRGFPDHTHLELTYDARGLLSSLGPVAPSVSWTTDGQLARVEFGNGVTDLRDYDERCRLRRLTTSAPDGGKLVDMELTLDGASRITAQRDLRSGVGSAESLTRSYAYDDRHRLISARDPVATTIWTYDDASNVRAVKSGHADPVLNVTNTFDDADGPDRMTRFGAEAISYDAAGRVIADGERTLEWDARGRLARVVRGDVVEEYVYDYAGVRAEKRTTTPSGTTVVRHLDRDVEVRDGALVRYVFLGEQRVARLDDVRLGSVTPVGSTSAQLGAPSGPPLNPWALAWLATAFGLVLVFARRREALVGPLSYVTTGWPWTAALLSAAALAPGCRCSGNQNGEPVSQRIDVLPTTAVLYHPDHQGSPLVLTDAHGKVVQRLAYHPFGALRSETGEREDPFGFVGNELDDATGLADFRARPYRSEAAMFLAPDPLAVFQPEKVLAEPWKLAPYGYAGADPIQRSDPTGLEGVTVIGAERIPRAMAAAPRISRQLPEGCETGASACWSSNAKFQGRVLSASYDEGRNVTTFRLEYRLTIHSAEIVTQSLEELRKTDAYNPDTGWTVRDHEWLHGYVDQRLYSKEHLEAVVRANGLDTVELPGRRTRAEHLTVANTASARLDSTVQALQDYWHALLVHRERPSPPGPR